MVGCQFGPKDAALWKKTGQMFLELGRPYYMKAQYCFGRAIKVFVVQYVWDDGDEEEEKDDQVLGGSQQPFFCPFHPNRSSCNQIEPPHPKAHIPM